MKILVIFTGGTIGSAVEDGFIAPGENKYRLIDMYRAKYGDDVIFETDNPFTILSENVTGDTLNALLYFVRAGLKKDYDGIIVTHGSDTLQYSAAALYFALGPVNVPIALVASNLVLDDERANGLPNFVDAVKYIAGGTPGVRISYEGIKHPVFALPQTIYEERIDELSVTELPVEFSPRTVDYISASSDVMWIKMHPGVSYYLSENTKAILFEGYHSGTLPTEDDVFKSFVQVAKRKNIPIYLVGAKQGTQYASCAAYDELGIVSLPRISPIAAYIWVWLYGRR